jgi:hypothetical protein
MAATVASQPNLPPVVALLCIFWIPWNYRQLRKNRGDTLAADTDARAYVSALQTFRQTSKSRRVFLYDGLPANFNWWGVDGALRFLYGYPPPELLSATSEPAGDRKNTALLTWDPATHKLAVIAFGLQ